MHTEYICENSYKFQAHGGAQMSRISIVIGLGIISVLFVSLSAYALCEVDLDADGDFDGRDIALFAEEFGRADCEAGPPCAGDLHPIDFPDGIVDKSDLAELGENLGRTDVGAWLDCGVIGDSIGAATHTDDACVSDPDGLSTELMNCLESQLGAHDTNWSFMGGTRPWAIANRVCCRNSYNTSDDGEQWKDALDQARLQIQTGQIGKIIVNLGSNDVCAKYGHDYGSLAIVQPTTPANVLSIEAEHFIQRFSGKPHRWELDCTAGASIKAVRTVPELGMVMSYPQYLAAGPHLDYKIHFVKAGTHYVWIRGFANGAGDDVVHVGLDGQRQADAENIKIKTFGAWTWSGATDTATTAAIDIPSAGIHTLNVYMAADGFRMDKIVLTTDEDWTPTSWGPFESARGIIRQEDQSGYALVAIETEHYHGLHNAGSHSWQPDFKPGYSGAAALRALPDNGVRYDDIAAAPRLDYNVNFKSPGTYHVWLRGYATADSDDSVSVGVDGNSDGTDAKIIFDAYNTWTWRNRNAAASAVTVDITSAGIHTVNIWMHKDGLRLDKIVMTQSAGFVPSGSGAPGAMGKRPGPDCGPHRRYHAVFDRTSTAHGNDILVGNCRYFEISRHDDESQA